MTRWAAVDFATANTIGGVLMRIQIISVARLLVALAFSFVLLATITITSAQAEEEPVTQSSNETMAAWIPYDYVNYTTNTKCNNRLKYLRSQYPDMNLGNTECRAVALPQCPPKTVYWIYILDKAGFSASKVAIEATPGKITPSDLALAC